MESLIIPPVSNSNEHDFNVILFEKKLMQLKDSQESINLMSQWCLENRMHHKKIVTAWLSVLKKVKVEQRLTLFYLANDVIQYSKRKNYDFVESWGTTLQKATTLVREEKVKNRILRIFKIWEQRGVYGEEFIADLSGLISASPSQKLNQDPQDFQPTYLISRIRSCAKLEADTDLKLKHLKDSSPKITDSETLCASLKDRRHVEDVEKEVESGILLIEGYVNALKAEIKSRTHLISCLTQGDTFYNEERKEVKVVVSAYKNFTTRVKNLQRKLDELKPNLPSPIPSPDINAPSPEPDSDTDLPITEESKIKCDVSSGVSVFSVTDTYNANYYTPSLQTQEDFSNNGFSSFMGSSMPFDLQSHTAANYNHPVQSQPIINYNPPPQQPLLPPPMPPFTTSYLETAPYTDTTYTPTTDSYVNNTSYEAVRSLPYAVSSEIQTSYAQTADAYNPEEEIETWEPEASWDAPPDLETPESPPIFEKEGFADPIEYDDSKNQHTGLIKDVDHRVLLPVPQIPPVLAEDTDLRVNRIGGSNDVDHRNLISLTGSPTNDPPPGLLQPPPAPPALWSELGDQDYRSQDQDYRDIARQLKLPPPPPPPPKTPSPYKNRQQQLGNHDNVESIDMDLSDDENINTNNSESLVNGGRLFENKNILTIVENFEEMLEPPPPIPQNLSNEMRQHNENGATMMHIDKRMMRPGIPHLQNINNSGWTDEWVPPPEFGDRQFRGNFHNHKTEFRGGFRGRGRGNFAHEHVDRFRGQGARGRGGMRTRPFRAGGNGRGNFINRGPRGGFRGKFRDF